MLRGLAAVFALLALLGGAGFAALQTQLGLAWFGRTAARALSSPGAVFRIKGVSGIAPFHLHANRVEIGDARGVWVAFRDVQLDLSPGALLAGHLQFDRLSAGDAEMRRQPVRPAAAAPVPWAERLRPPRVSYPLAIEKLAVGRIVLDPPVLGERVAATLAGSVDFVGAAMHATLDLHRIDGEPGSVSLALGMGGTPAVLNLNLRVSEPTGAVLDRVLGRTDRPPLALSLAGKGPVADWHGQLRASAGDLARIDAAIAMQTGREAALQLSGIAAVARLVPTDLAPLLGDTVAVSAGGELKQDGAVSLDRLKVAAAAGTLTGDGEFARPDHRVAGHFHLALPHLAAMRGPAGVPTGGAARIDATIGGTEASPTLSLRADGDAVAVGTAQVSRATAQLTVTPAAPGGSATSGLEIAARGDIRGLATPAFPAALTRDIGWSLTARSAAGLAGIDISRFAAHGAGIDVSGSGRVASGGDVNGKLHLAIADLAPLASAFGPKIAGAVSLDATASRQASGRIAAKIDGALSGLRSGVKTIDALAGRTVAIAASAHRDPDGAAVVDRLKIAGAAVRLDGSGRFDPATRRVGLSLDGAVPDLHPVGAALGIPVAGRVTLAAKAEGPADRLRVEAKLAAADLDTPRVRLDRLDLDAQVPDLASPTLAASGRFRAGDLDGALSLDADARDPREIAIPRLRLIAGGGTFAGNLRIERATGLARGTLDGALPDLARWSRLAGTTLAGSLRFKAALAARRGQALNLTLSGDRVGLGNGASRLALGQFRLSGAVDDLRGMPFGNARASLRDAVFSGGAVESAAVVLDSPQPGRLAFTVSAAGKFGDKFALALGGDGRIGSGASAIDIRLARLAGSLGNERIGLDRPLVLHRAANELAVENLALRFGPGRIAGGGAIRGAALSLRLAGNGLPVSAAARLAGWRRASGTISFSAALGGSTRAPSGRFSLRGRGLDLSGAKAGGGAGLGLDVAGDWNGRALALNGRVGGLKGDMLNVSGTLPLVFSAQPLRLAMPADRPLTMRVRGAGDLAGVAELLPLGEDRLSGHFALDAAATGTLAAPSGSGSLKVSGGRYENFATGALLADLRLDMAGDNRGFVLRSLSASDGASGSIAASGRLLLGGAHGPAAQMNARLSRFRLTARDQGVVTASGTIAVTGPVASPMIAADLTTDQGEFRIPELGPKIARLQVVETGGPTGAKSGAVQPAPPPALPARLDLRITVPGRLFVRGHGINSEWRGRLHVTGTSAAPNIAGMLEAVRGTVDLLGKTFRVTQGRIDFEGGAALDPAIQIAAETTTGDVTAKVVVSGLASSPKVALTSVPALPQDQILSRVLFDRPLNQISVGEGLQVASAAATLAGGGISVLDKLRSSLGLDRLVFGSSSGSALAATNAAKTDAGPAISGGKYVANGVYVGATQGLTAQSSKLTVDIEVRPHVTVQTDVGAASGTGLGINYKYDY